MKIVLAGGTGFIGKALRESLTERDHEVVILTRQVSRENDAGIRTRFRHWNPPEGGTWEKELDGAGAVINLSGEPIVGKRWSVAQKKRILESRTQTAGALVRAFEKARVKPGVFINASAIGYYGERGDETVTEETRQGNGFLAETCKTWEAEVLKAEGLGLRVIRLRIGIVLEKGGGALAKMLPPFQLGLGGPLGSGLQWMSWIHLKDLVGLIHFLLEKKETRGAFNATAPNPVTMKEFARTLGRVLRRPAFFPVPTFVLKILLGESADLLLTGQRVLPKHALEAGYRFQFPELEPALKEILTR